MHPGGTAAITTPQQWWEQECYHFLLRLLRFYGQEVCVYITWLLHCSYASVHHHQQLQPQQQLQPLQAREDPEQQCHSRTTVNRQRCYCGTTVATADMQVSSHCSWQL